MQRKLVLLVLVLLLISVGIVVAQSSANFIVQRFVVAGGGSADSANYALTSVIGQPVWETYLKGEESDPRVALQNVVDAVQAELKRG